MNSKMTTNSQLSTTGPQNKNKLSQQLEHTRITEMEITWRVIIGVGGQMEGKVQGIRSIIGSYKIDRGMLRIVQEMEKPRNLYVGSMDMN